MACTAAVAGGIHSHAQGAPQAAPPKTTPQKTTPKTAPKVRAVVAPEARVDINHASAEELAKIPGLTPSWAGRIIRFRPYRTKQDLLERGVLPSDVYDRIKDQIIAHRGE
jgi:DNA uptake protein ComE-like DNA-binding protein